KPLIGLFAMPPLPLPDEPPSIPENSSNTLRGSRSLTPGIAFIVIGALIGFAGMWANNSASYIVGIALIVLTVVVMFFRAQTWKRNIKFISASGAMVLGAIAIFAPWY